MDLNLKGQNDLPAGRRTAQKKSIPQHRNMVAMREPKKMSRKSIKNKENVEPPT